ncbi:insulin receptor substrate 2-like isoform X1 [Pseudochaenichthys georgianus]|uniref:insulin receptor substrate 2-like isoform X1 n=1 Tax=Pseudochaenichthys georgianus TaxID=52239 RepID=UPI00146B0491|nr:insulin receptor substrate 2-like isoform X1 [Pseudochaenichthys georgianus]
MASPPATGGHLLSNGTYGVKKCGYLRKQKHGHRRFFVLREPTERCPARLEYYESEKKWRNKSAAKRVITLDSCLCVNKRADAKHKHLIALYTKDEYFAVAADNEQEQESWYSVLTDLIAEGKVYDSPASTSSLVGFEEANYGLITPATAVYKEVWQVNLKSKGLGQIKNLTGVYRLCLSSRTISFVKLNSETAAVSLQLMNIRRCGHSDTFFFIEVGRSAVTGPGEFWMQAEDSVVAQNIHETILEAMKAMKELSEFRPRSKSQSASTNPISVPTRRNLNNLPPSQTGLVRRSRTDSMAANSPGRKFTSCRVRTASEGDGSVTRPVSMSISVNGSPTSPNSGNLLIRSHTLSSGRTCRILESSSNLHHSRSMPVSNSPPGTSSPISMSPRGASISTPDKIRRPFSCSASISGSLSDTGFMLCDDYSSSPSEPRFTPLTRSNTPDSLSSTPPSRDISDPCGYMIMEGGNVTRSGVGVDGLACDNAYRKRTHSLTTPRQQRAVAPLASASLDDYTLMRMAHGQNSHSASPKVCYPEDYGDVEIGSSRSSSSNLADDGYMPMTPGLTAQSGKVDYMPMSPMCVSAPKQIVNPRVHPPAAVSGGHKTNSPCSSSLEDSGYMRMWCSSKSSMESLDRNGEYMNMSPGNPPPLQTPPDYYLGLLSGEHAAVRSAYQGGSLTLPAKLQASKNEESNQYVLMSPQSLRQRVGESDYYSVMQPNAAPLSPSVPSPVRQGRAESLPYRGRLGRPNRLSLDTLRTLPSMNEHPLPGEPRSPGEYINIDFSCARFSPPSNVSTESQSSSLGSSGGGPGRSSLSDYMNLELGSHSRKEAHTPAERLDTLPELSMCSEEDRVYHLEGEKGSQGLCDEGKNDYTEMTFGMTSSPPQLVPQNTASSQSSRERRLSLEDQGVPECIGAFLLGGTSSSAVDPDCAAKVIRANPQGRRRHSSETFSSTATVTPVFPSFARGDMMKRHSSVENISSRSSEGSDEEYGNSPVNRQSSAGYANGLNYIALNLLDNRDVEKCEGLAGFKPTSSCKGGINGLHSSPYVCLGFKEAATTAKD